MKKKLAFLFLTMLMPTTLVISACDSVSEIDPSVIVEDEKGEEEAPDSSEHICKHVCTGCGKCLDDSCTDPVCAEKCDCFTPLPQHTCHSVCFDCGKCTDLTCTDPVCADKCTCGGMTEVHTCGHVCSTCGKCTDESCTDPVCAEKCTCSFASEEEDPIWPVNFSLYGASFRNYLGELITDKVTNTTTYKQCLSVGQKAAAVGSKFVPFYHGKDYTVSTSTSCNREHTWPNSRGGGDKAGGSNIEKDPFMIRPTLTTDNSSRGNDYYGDPNEKINGKTYSNQWDPASCGYENARGEAARIIFYVATRYGKSNNLKLTNNPSDAASNRSMGTLKTLIAWNLAYEPTDMEKQINNYLDDQGYGRNPFVDHPEYVKYIWNDDGLLTSPLKAAVNNKNYIDDNNYTLNVAIEDLSKAVSCIYPTNN